MKRRQFLKSAAATAAGVFAFNIIPRHVLGGPKFVAPSDKVNVALIGCGGRARQNAQGLMKYDDAQITAIADPAEYWDLKNFYYKSIAGRLPVKGEIEKFYGEKKPGFKCTDYEDFRVMLEKQKDIDAVLISTPDHQHAHGSAICMRAGKHVYCEKPLTHNIREARLLAKIAKETGVSTQMGNVGHTKETMATTVENLRAGVIGDVREIHAWVPAKRWNPELQGMPKETPELPKGLNWDMWLGPRSERPWHPAYAPVSWRDFWEFGLGSLGDFGCHDLDSATWALDLLAPESIEASNAGKTHDLMTPHGSLVFFHFAAKGKQKPVKITWYDGGLMPELPDEARESAAKYKRATMFVGDKGTMICEGAGGPALTIFKDKNATAPKVEATVPRTKDNYRDWLDGCKGGRAPLSNFEYAARLTEITLLGVLAVRTGKKLMWDYDSMSVTNAKDSAKNVEEILRGTYRRGWIVE